MTGDDIGKLAPILGGILIAVGTPVGLWYTNQKDKRADQATLLKMAGDQLTGLSTQLMSERGSRESAITALQDEARHMRDEIRAMRDENRVMREEGQKREDRLTLAEKDLVQFWLYAGDLEGLLRERGIEPPTRPPTLYVIRGATG